MMTPLLLWMALSPAAEPSVTPIVQPMSSDQWRPTDPRAPEGLGSKEVKVLPADETAVAAAAARAVLNGCGPTGEVLARLPDLHWTSRKSALDDHKSLRSALGAPIPEASTQVRLYAAGGHLADYWTSTVLTRDAAGLWRGTEVGRGRLWGEGEQMQPLPAREWTLSEEDGRKVDAILADPCFYAEPTSGFVDPSLGPPPRNSRAVNFETVTPERSRQTWFLTGTATGRTAALFRLILPKRVP